MSHIYNKIGKIKQRASQKGLDFDLTTDWYREKLEKGVCEVTGIEFDVSSYNPKEGLPPFIPSIDRIDPKKGYTCDNCRMVVMALNQCKGEFTTDELYIFAKELLIRRDL